MKNNKGLLIFAVIEGVLLLIVVLAGGIVTIIKPHTLPFENYVRDITILAGVLGIGAGVAAAAAAGTNNKE